MAETVRALYTIVGDMLDEQPREMMQCGLVVIKPTIGKTLVLMHIVAFNVPLSEIREWTRRYYEMDVVVAERNEGTYPDDYMPSASVVGFPVDVQAYILNALTFAVEKFVEMTIELELESCVFVINRVYLDGCQ
ncbi:hypothetical protein PSPO01_05831 [Paraphaeosphaeria sporulosa]